MYSFEMRAKQQKSIQFLLCAITSNFCSSFETKKQLAPAAELELLIRRWPEVVSSLFWFFMCCSFAIARISHSSVARLDMPYPDSRSMERIEPSIKDDE